MEGIDSEIVGPDGRHIEITTFAPPGAADLPGWIALHGITVPGRFHPSLVRFARALASSGAVVVIPEVAPWRELRLDAPAAAHAVSAVLDALDADPRTSGRPGLVGFSFGGPQVIRIAGDPELGPRLSGVASFGGFADIETTMRFQMTGRIETEKGPVTVRPDPYARWIVAANYLPHVGAGGEFEAVARALHDLALEAGRRRTPSWEPLYDPLKERLAASLSTMDQLEAFRLFAPPSTEDPRAGHPEVEAWVARLAEAARRVEPGLEVPRGMALHTPAHILHGRSDTLIPFTEAEAMRARIGSPDPTCTVTGLFAHSGREGGVHLGTAFEAVRLANALRRVLRIPDRTA